MIWPNRCVALGGGNSNIFNFHPIPGEMIQFDEHIFQGGWFNHQPELVFFPTKICISEEAMQPDFLIRHRFFVLLSRNFQYASMCKFVNGMVHDGHFQSVSLFEMIKTGWLNHYSQEN